MFICLLVSLWVVFEELLKYSGGYGCCSGG